MLIFILPKKNSRTSIQRNMKKKDTFRKFAPVQITNPSEVKGGIRVGPVMPGGSGGNGWIDWGDTDIRTFFGYQITVRNNKISMNHMG